MDQLNKELNDAHNITQTIITTSSSIRPVAVSQPPSHHQNHRHNHRHIHHTKSSESKSRPAAVDSAAPIYAFSAAAAPGPSGKATSNLSSSNLHSNNPTSSTVVPSMQSDPTYPKPLSTSANVTTTTTNAMVHHGYDGNQSHHRKKSNEPAIAANPKNVAVEDDYDAFNNSVDYNNKLLDNFVAGFANMTDGNVEQESANNNNNTSGGRSKKLSVASTTNATYESNSVAGDDDEDKFDTMELMPIRSHLHTSAPTSPQPCSKLKPPSEEELTRICSLTAQKLKALVELIDADKAQLKDLRTGLDQASVVLNTVTRLQTRHWTATKNGIEKQQHVSLNTSRQTPSGVNSIPSALISSSDADTLPNRNNGQYCIAIRPSPPSAVVALSIDSKANSGYGLDRQNTSPTMSNHRCVAATFSKKTSDSTAATVDKYISPIGFYVQPQQQCLVYHYNGVRKNNSGHNKKANKLAHHQSVAAIEFPSTAGVFKHPAFSPSTPFVPSAATQRQKVDTGTNHRSHNSGGSLQAPNCASPESSAKSTQTEKRLLDMTAVHPHPSSRRTQSAESAQRTKPAVQSTARQRPTKSSAYAKNDVNDDDDNDLFYSSSTSYSTPSNALYSASASLSTSSSSPVESGSIASFDSLSNDHPQRTTSARGSCSSLTEQQLTAMPRKDFVGIHIEHVQRTGAHSPSTGDAGAKRGLTEKPSEKAFTQHHHDDQPSATSTHTNSNINTVTNSNVENRPSRPYSPPERNVHRDKILQKSTLPVESNNTDTAVSATEQNEPETAKQQQRQVPDIPDILVDGELEESTTLVLPEKSVYISRQARKKLAKQQQQQQQAPPPQVVPVPSVVVSGDDGSNTDTVAGDDAPLASFVVTTAASDSSKQHLSLNDSGAKPKKPATKRKKPRKAKQLSSPEQQDDEDEDELSDVEQDSEVPSEVKEWLADTFTRRRSSLAPKVVEKRKFKSVANAIRAGIFVDRLFQQNRLYRRLSSNLGLPTSIPVVQALKNIDEWTFDVFMLDKASEGHALRSVMNALLTKYDLYSKLKIATPTLDHFVRAMEEGYSKNNNPYHNPIHAADVAQTMHYMMFNTGLVNWLTDVEVFASIFAAVIHDFEHTGTTNNFHIATLSDLALLYNDRAVLENHHLSAAFRVMQNDENNIAANLSRDDFYTFRALVVEMVLATDMSFHFAQVKHIKAMCTAAPDSIDKAKALSLVLHCCDISHPGKPWHLHSAWTSSLLAEFFTQGDREKELDLPYSPLCDRNNIMVPQSQIGFIDIIVEPTMMLVGTMIEKIVEPLLNLEKQAREKEAAAAATTAATPPFLTTDSTTGSTAGGVKTVAAPPAAGGGAPDNIMARMGRTISVGSNVNMLNRQRIAAETTTTASVAVFERPWIKCLEDNKALWRQKAAAGNLNCNGQLSIRVNLIAHAAHHC